MPRTELNGIHLYYELQGRGRPLFVFVHGGMCDHRDWTRQVRRLKLNYSVLTLDLRGHGLSKGAFVDCRIERWADDVNALIEVLRLKGVTLVGHSLGARIVVEATARSHPGSVGALVLLDGSRMHGGFSASDSAMTRDGSGQSAAWDALIGPYADAATRSYLVKNLSGAPPALVQAVADTIRAWDSQRADAAFAAIDRQVPMLVVQSTYHDRFTPRYSLETQGQRTPYLDHIRAAIPRAIVRIVTGAGHFCMLERSDQVTSLIEEFAVNAERGATGESAP